MCECVYLITKVYKVIYLIGKHLVVTVYVEYVLRLSHFMLDIYWIEWNLISVSAAGLYEACTATPSGLPVHHGSH